jgi:hypothetical protein
MKPSNFYQIEISSTDEPFITIAKAENKFKTHKNALWPLVILTVMATVTIAVIIKKRKNEKENQSN